LNAYSNGKNLVPYSVLFTQQTASAMESKKQLVVNAPGKNQQFVSWLYWH